MTSAGDAQSSDLFLPRDKEIGFGLLISMLLYFYIPISIISTEDPFGLFAALESLLLGIQLTFESTYLPAMVGAPFLWNLLACYAIVQLVRTFPWQKTGATLLIAHFRFLVVLPVYVSKITALFIAQLVYLVWCMIRLGELHQNRKFAIDVHPFVHKPSAAEAEEE